MASTGGLKGYNGGAMLLHWLIAAAILFQLAAGFAMANLDALPDTLRFALFQWHKTVGLTVLALTLARIAWRVLNPPPPETALTAPERVLAGLVHLLFYLFMVAVPLSGWLLVSASATRIPTLLFLSSALPWPHLPVGTGLQEPAEVAHVWMAYGLLPLLGLHVAGAIKHSLVDRVPSFSRMLPLGSLERPPANRRAAPVALALIVLFLGGGLVIGRLGEANAPAAVETAAPLAAAEASAWTLDPAASRLGYEVTFSGSTVTGEIGRWNAAIAFDPDHLDQASARIAIDAASITVSDSYIGSNLGGDDGLQLATHPTAEVVLDSFARGAEGFVARGTVTIRGVSVPVEVPFTFQAEADGTARVEGSATLDRLAFGLGAQNDADGSWLGKSIKVVFSLVARPAS